MFSWGSYALIAEISIISEAQDEKSVFVGKPRLTVLGNVASSENTDLEQGSTSFFPSIFTLVTRLYFYFTLPVAVCSV